MCEKCDRLRKEKEAVALVPINLLVREWDKHFDQDVTVLVLDPENFKFAAGSTIASAAHARMTAAALLNYADQVEASGPDCPTESASREEL
ncbi:hypothetical protein [Corynebacterium flavescens]|uniref:hypothetical protein n=1 Tax=Corynebacterium flavescens TaxID=28028 RepID=UPI00289D4B60|nr:hypothetical protein [Corynebacterium flavescens]